MKTVSNQLKNSRFPASKSFRKHSIRGIFGSPFINGRYELRLRYSDFQPLFGMSPQNNGKKNVFAWSCAIHIYNERNSLFSMLGIQNETETCATSRSNRYSTGNTRLASICWSQRTQFRSLTANTLPKTINHFQQLQSLTVRVSLICLRGHVAKLDSKVGYRRSFFFKNPDLLPTVLHECTTLPPIFQYIKDTLSQIEHRL